MEFFEIVDDLLMTKESTISRFHCIGPKLASVFHDEHDFNNLVGVCWTLVLYLVAK